MVDPDAFRDATEPYHSEMFKVALRVTCQRQDAEDAVQEALGRAYTSWDRRDPTIGTLSGWLTRIAHREALRLVEKRGRRRDFEESAEPSDAVLVSSDRTEERAISNLELGPLLAGLQALPAHVQRVVILRKVHELEWAEIADELSLPESEVKSLHDEGIAQLGLELREAAHLEDPRNAGPGDPDENGHGCDQHRIRELLSELGTRHLDCDRASCPCRAGDRPTVLQPWMLYCLEVLVGHRMWCGDLQADQQLVVAFAGRLPTTEGVTPADVDAFVARLVQHLGPANRECLLVVYRATGQGVGRGGFEQFVGPGWGTYRFRKTHAALHVLDEAERAAQGAA